jgi:hypothetical protein
MLRRSSRLILASGLLFALILVAVWLTRSPAPASGSDPSRSAAQSATATTVAENSATSSPMVVAAPPASLPPRSTEPRSELVDGLNDPRGTIEADLRLLNEVFSAWLTHFRDAGIPIGDNREVTAALTGNNSLGYAFVPADHPAINTRRELCDRWGTPFRFHVLSRMQMEIRSAGPDRRFGTADDAEWAPWPRNF